MFLVVVFIIIIIILFFIGGNKVTTGCKVFLQNYNNENAKLHNLLDNSDMLDYTLSDFYVKSAYNCCALKNYKYDYVDLCGLEMCIKRGVRFLDFEIYSVKDKPVIAVSSVDNNYVIESYNYLQLSDAFSTIVNMAFNSRCPNPLDPLFINLRIKSTNTKMYDAIANLLHDKLEYKLLGRKYSYEFRDKNNDLQNIGRVKIKNFVKKVIICVEDENQILRTTKLDEFTNIANNQNTGLFNILRANQIKHRKDSIVEYNKRNMTVVLPNIGSSPTNMDSDLIEQLSGAQFCAMCFQNRDSYLKRYEDKFEQGNSKFAFRLKPDNQRYKELYIDASTLTCDPTISSIKDRIHIPGVDGYVDV